MNRAHEHDRDSKVTTNEPDEELPARPTGGAWEPSDVQAKAALLLSQNVPYRDIAGRCGVSLSTILRWTRLPGMRFLAADWRFDRLQRHEDKYAQLLEESIEVLIDHIRGHTPSTAAVKAARARVRELDDTVGVGLREQPKPDTAHSPSRYRPTPGRVLGRPSRPPSTVCAHGCGR